MFKKKQSNNAYGEQNQKARPRTGKFKPGKIVGIFIGIIAAAYLLVGSVYSLRENEYAVVTTFGVPGEIGRASCRERV